MVCRLDPNRKPPCKISSQRVKEFNQLNLEAVVLYIHKSYIFVLI